MTAWLDRALELARLAQGRSRPYKPSSALWLKGEQILAEVFGSSEDVLQKLDEKACSQGDSVFLLVEPPPRDWGRLRFLPKRCCIGQLDPAYFGAGQAAIEAWVPTEVLDRPEIADFLRPYFEAERLGRPFVTLKVASSLDGRVATRTGQSQWITGEAARARGRALRAEHDAILVGITTAIADDPALTTRIDGRPDPIRCVLDRQGRLPVESKLVQTASQTATWMFSQSPRPHLSEYGVRVEPVPVDGEGRLDLRAVLARLYGLGVRTVLVEGGPTVAGAFMDRSLIDRVAWFVAPKLLGGTEAPGALGGRGVGALSASPVLRAWRVEPIGEDILIVGEIDGVGRRS